jgi:eukaryotic-like serine/threonine-protein kinase
MEDNKSIEKARLGIAASVKRLLSRLPATTFPRTGNQMQLWNEYEGRIVADQFPLKTLLEPEGRSAFFSTTNGSGAPAVIRLIEAHFDEPEILSRWTAVSKVDQPNLIKLKKFGQTTLDETALLYAVMEPSDASLADILKDRSLSTKETTEIATSLVPALQALHAANLIHEHVEPGNVLAVGEVIKLRSDCIREVPEGADANEFKTRDVHGLVITLLQALTQQRYLPAGTTLPAPFQEIVTNGISGAWGLSQIAAALGPATPVPARKPEAAPLPLSRSESKEPAAASPTKAPTYTRTEAPEPTRRVVAPVATENEPRRILPWTTIAAVVILALFLGWHFLHKSPPAIPTLATIPAQANPNATAARDASPSSQTASTASTENAASAESNAPATTGARTQWRVVAFTYNHENQAKDKVAQILSKHADLRPEVFAPRGRAPYLVTVGGSMSRDEALAFRRTARSQGLPRDTYAQNFPANAR